MELFCLHRTVPAGRVLHDAVYDFTGRVDFISMVDRLFREELAYGKVDDPKKWFANLVKTVEENPFLTETAQKTSVCIPGGTAECPSGICRGEA